MSVNGQGAETCDRSKRLTPLEVAARLGVGETKVRRWIELGQLRAVDVASEQGPNKPRRWRVSVEDLAAFETARANKSLPAVPAVSRTKAERAKEVTEFIT